MSYVLGQVEVASGTITEREMPTDHTTVLMDPITIEIPKGVAPRPSLGPSVLVGATLALVALTLLG